MDHVSNLSRTSADIPDMPEAFLGYGIVLPVIIIAALVSMGVAIIAWCAYCCKQHYRKKSSGQKARKLKRCRQGASGNGNVASSRDERVSESQLERRDGEMIQSRSTFFTPRDRRHASSEVPHRLGILDTDESHLAFVQRSQNPSTLLPSDAEYRNTAITIPEPFDTLGNPSHHSVYHEMTSDIYYESIPDQADYTNTAITLPETVNTRGNFPQHIFGQKMTSDIYHDSIPDQADYTNTAITFPESVNTLGNFPQHSFGRGMTTDIYYDSFPDQSEASGSISAIQNQAFENRATDSPYRNTMTGCVNTCSRLAPVCIFEVSRATVVASDATDRQRGQPGRSSGTRTMLRYADNAPAKGLSNKCPRITTNDLQLIRTMLKKTNAAIK